MANEILYSGLTDLRTTEVLSKELLLSLADREALQNHPALVYAGDAQGTGSTTLKIGQLGWDGYDQLSSVSEGSAVTNTALTDASTTVAVARYAKQYEVSDLARITDSLGIFSDPAAWARDSVASAAMTLTNLIANLVDDFSSTVGTSGSNLTVANWFEAMATLETGNVKGPYLAIIHGQQYADLRDALRSETGALHIMQATHDQMAIRGSGYKGSFLGVDIMVSNQVPTANTGADRAGGMFGRGAIAWADATIPVDPTADAIFAGKVMVEFERSADSALKKVVTNYYVGAAEAIDAAGVSIITDA